MAGENDLSDHGGIVVWHFLLRMETSTELSLLTKVSLGVALVAVNQRVQRTLIPRERKV